MWLRRLLAGRLGIAPESVAYREGAKGKPELAPELASSLRFSMSRSGGLALYAFAAGREVGVDLQERLAADLGALERRLLSPGEQELLEGLEGTEREEGFFRLWARKEAFVKAVGVGIGVPLAAIDVTGEHPRLERHPAELAAAGGAWSLRDLEVADGFAAAVAIEGSLRAALLVVRRAGPSLPGAGPGRSVLSRRRPPAPAGPGTPGGAPA